MNTSSRDATQWMKQINSTRNIQQQREGYNSFKEFHRIDQQIYTQRYHRHINQRHYMIKKDTLKDRIINYCTNYNKLHPSEPQKILKEIISNSDSKIFGSIYTKPLSEQILKKSDVRLHRCLREVKKKRAENSLDNETLDIFCRQLSVEHYNTKNISNTIYFYSSPISLFNNTIVLLELPDKIVVDQLKRYSLTHKHNSMSSFRNFSNTRSSHTNRSDWRSCEIFLQKNIKKNTTIVNISQIDTEKISSIQNRPFYNHCIVREEDNLHLFFRTEKEDYSQLMSKLIPENILMSSDSPGSNRPLLRKKFAEKVSKLIDKLKLVSQSNQGTVSIESTSILELIRMVFRYDYLHIDHVLQIGSPSDIMNAMTEHGYSASEFIWKKKIDTAAAKTIPKPHLKNIQTSGTKYDPLNRDVKFNKNIEYKRNCQKQIDRLNKQAELMKFIVELEKNYERPLSALLSGQEALLSKALFAITTKENTCACNGQKIKVSDYSINDVVVRSSGKLDCINNARPDKNHNLMLEKTGNSRVKVQCGVSNCQLQADLRTQRKMMSNQSITEIVKNLKSRTLDRATTTTTTQSDSDIKKDHLEKLKKMLDESVCSCLSTNTNAITENFVKYEVDREKQVRLLTLYSHKDCIKQSRNNLDNVMKFKMNVIKQWYKQLNRELPKKLSTFTSFVQNEEKSSMCVEKGTLLDEVRQMIVTHPNDSSADRIHSVFPIFQENTFSEGGYESANSRLTKDQKMAGKINSLILPSKEMLLCANHATLISSIWILLRWEDELKFQFLRASGFISPHETYKINAKINHDYVAHFYLSHHHLVHNTLVKLNISNLLIDEWMKYLDTYIEKVSPLQDYIKSSGSSSSSSSNSSVISNRLKEKFFKKVKTAGRGGGREKRKNDGEFKIINQSAHKKQKRR